jgi:hypothetical protein
MKGCCIGVVQESNPLKKREVGSRALRKTPIFDCLLFSFYIENNLVGKREDKTTDYI